MAFNKKTWTNLPNTTTPVNATGMNDLETRINNAFIIGDILSIPANSITSDSDLDDYSNAGTYSCNTATIAQTLANTPYKNGAFKLIVMKMHDVSRYVQIIITLDSSTSIYVRNYAASGWTSWYKLSSTVVS